MPLLTLQCMSALAGSNCLFIIKNHDKCLTISFKVAITLTKRHYFLHSFNNHTNNYDDLCRLTGFDQRFWISSCLTENGEFWHGAHMFQLSTNHEAGFLLTPVLVLTSMNGLKTATEMTPVGVIPTPKVTPQCLTPAWCCTFNTHWC